jgi:hypothetical protein
MRAVPPISALREALAARGALEESRESISPTVDTNEIRIFMNACSLLLLLLLLPLLLLLLLFAVLLLLVLLLMLL